MNRAGGCGFLCLWFNLTLAVAQPSTVDFEQEMLQLCGGNKIFAKRCAVKLAQLEAQRAESNTFSLRFQAIIARAYLNHASFDYPPHSKESEKYRALGEEWAKMVLESDPENLSAWKTLANSHAMTNSLNGYVTQLQKLKFSDAHDDHHFAGYLLGRIDTTDLLAVQETHYLEAISSAPNRFAKTGYAMEFVNQLRERNMPDRANQFAAEFSERNPGAVESDFGGFLNRLEAMAPAKRDSQLANSEISYFCGVSVFTVLGTSKCRLLLEFALGVTSSSEVLAAVSRATEYLEEFDAENSY